MMCPGDVGRDSGEWGGQESEVLQDWKSHQELGEEALAEGAVLGVGTECPKVLSDCCCCVLVVGDVVSSVVLWLLLLSSSLFVVVALL